jgi:hypothetical protein
VPVVAASLAVSVVVVAFDFVVVAASLAVSVVFVAVAAASVVEFVAVAVAAADGSDFYLIAAAAAEQGDSAEADGNTVSSAPRAVFVPSMVIFAVASN